MYHRVARRFMEAAWGMPAMPRGSYLPPDVRDTDPVNPEGTDLAIWKYEYGNKFVAIAFQGRANKPLWHYNFKSDSSREAYIREAIENRKSQLQQKQDRMQERREWQHGFQEDDILVSSWGYDQTNVNFYQVTKVIGATIILQEISSKLVRSSPPQDYVVPIKDHFVGRPIRKIPSGRGGEKGYVRINSVQYAYPWNGKPQYETTTGWGH